MNLLTITLPFVIFISLAHHRKPWYYGLPDTHEKLKSQRFRFILMSLFVVHTVLALYYATLTYIRLFFT